jgi:hypothetical protein
MSQGVYLSILSIFNQLDDFKGIKYWQFAHNLRSVHNTDIEVRLYMHFLRMSGYLRGCKD